jgi:hypothetical protein
MTENPDSLEPLRLAAAWSVVRGSLMFHLDLAAMIARERLAGNPLIEDADGWAVDVTARGYEVIFISDAPSRELAIVTFAADGAPIVEPGRGSPSTRSLALAAAARTIAAADGPALRTVIALPPSDGSIGAELEGYMLRFPDGPYDVALGPHSRFRLSPDGREMRAAEPLSVSDLVLPSRGRGDLEGVTVTHLLGDVPSEAHVYLSLRHNMAIDVVTASNEEHWRVDGESISLL